MTAYIDVHHHLLPDFYIDEVGMEPILTQAPRYSSVALEWTAQKSLDAMDENGVALALLSISAPGLWFGDRDATVRLARRCNDYMASLVQQFPTRFGMFAALPLPAVDASLAEIAHCADTLCTDGFGLFSSYGNQYLGAPEFAPVFDELNRRGATVFVHPNAGEASRRLLPDFPASILEFPLDTTRSVMSLLFSGTMARCPNVRFIFSHAGGAVPFLAHRMARLEAVETFAEKTPGGAMKLLQRQYYDTALSANEPALAALTKFVPTSQILFGSDFPFAPGMMGRTISTLKNYGFDEESHHAIACANARTILRGVAGRVGNTSAAPENQPT